jgi:hypothetical protein
VLATLRSSAGVTAWFGDIEECLHAGHLKFGRGRFSGPSWSMPSPTSLEFGSCVTQQGKSFQPEPDAAGPSR